MCVFAACSNSKADYFTYSESNLGVVGKLVKWMHSWVGNYGWTVVVFTVFLKILMTPLDIWQRVSSRKSTLRMQRMQPLMAEIDKRYASNPQRANEEKQKLYKKEGFSAFSMCLPLIISMVIFFVMFGGLRQYSTYSSVTNFQNLSGTYYDEYYKQVKADGNDKLELTYKKDGVEVTATFHDSIAGLLEDATGFGENENFLRDNYTEKNVNAFITAINWLQDSETVNHLDAQTCDKYNTAALEAVGEFYKNNHESWLWINNVWQPDTWAPIMPKYTDRANGFSSSVNMEQFDKDQGRSHYDAIWGAVVQTGGYGKNGSWNGLMILPVLSIAMSFLSMFISQRMERKNRKGEVVAQNQQQKTTNMMMMIMMPLMMAYFGFIYTGAFAIYMVVNSTLTILSTILMRYPVEKMVMKRLNKDEQKNKSGQASYMR